MVETISDSSFIAKQAVTQESEIASHPFVFISIFCRRRTLFVSSQVFCLADSFSNHVIMHSVMKINSWEILLEVVSEQKIMTRIRKCQRKKAGVEGWIPFDWLWLWNILFKIKISSQIQRKYYWYKDFILKIFSYQTKHIYWNKLINSSEFLVTKETL